MTAIYYPNHNILSLIVPNEAHDIDFFPVVDVQSSA
jgi:hypothetical protein